MLETIKEVLISDMQQELHRRKKIDKEIKMITEERNQKQHHSFEILSKMESDINELNKNSFRRIINSKKLKALYNQYMVLSNSVRDEIRLLNEKIESLYQKIHDLSHDEVLIKKEIEGIKQATSLQELGLTEKTALNYIKSDEKKVIRAVFKNIKDNQSLETSTDIDRNINALYQTNLSPFVVAMQKIKLKDLVNELADIGIIVDEDKIKFLEALKNYTEAPKQRLQPSIVAKEKLNDLDRNFYDQVERDLEYMNIHASYPSLAVSKIVTLAVLVSMLKENKNQE